MIKRILHPVTAANQQVIGAQNTFSIPISPAFEDTSKVSVLFESLAVSLQSISSNSVVLKCTNTGSSGYLYYVEIIEFA